VVKVFIEKESRSIKMKAKDIDEIIKRLGINREEVMIVRNNELTPRNERLKDTDEIKFLSVISGG